MQKSKFLTSFLRVCCVSVFIITLISCTAFPKNIHTTGQLSELEQGKRYFDQGYYKRAMTFLLPIACDGNPDAQYAVGYMYYYGLGVAQDTEVGYFWIQRAANHGYSPGSRALTVMDPQTGERFKPQDRYR